MSSFAELSLSCLYLTLCRFSFISDIDFFFLRLQQQPGGDERITEGVTHLSNLTWVTPNNKHQLIETSHTPASCDPLMKAEEYVETCQVKKRTFKVYVWDKRKRDNVLLLVHTDENISNNKCNTLNQKHTSWHLLILLGVPPQIEVALYEHRNASC